MLHIYPMCGIFNLPLHRTQGTGHLQFHVCCEGQGLEFGSFVVLPDSGRELATLGMSTEAEPGEHTYALRHPDPLYVCMYVCMYV